MMQHDLRLIYVALTLAATIVFVGCTEMRPPDELGRTNDQANRDVSNGSSREDNAGSHYVTCLATFTTFNENFAWFENSDAVQDDGVAPLASFQIQEPSSNIDRVVNILFKYDADNDIPGPPSEGDLGEQFSFELPEHTFTDSIPSIDNLAVKNLRKFRP